MAVRNLPIDKGRILSGEMWEFQVGELEIDLTYKVGGVEIRVFTSRHSEQGIQFVGDHFVTFPSRLGKEASDAE